MATCRTAQVKVEYALTVLDDTSDTVMMVGGRASLDGMNAAVAAVESSLKELQAAPGSSFKEDHTKFDQAF
jgi:hypothetical protein